MFWMVLQASKIWRIAIQESRAKLEMVWKYGDNLTGALLGMENYFPLIIFESFVRLNLLILINDKRTL